MTTCDITISEKKRTAYRHALLMKAIREGDGETGGDQGEGKFGAVPLGVDLNKLLNTPNESLDAVQGQDFAAHPLLSKSQQYCGDDNLSPDITLNEAARNSPELALRLQNQLQHTLQQKQRKSTLPTLGR